jgi:Carboxypeptidase regulatory-like domain/TonB dependent receptor
MNSVLEKIMLGKVLLLPILCLLVSAPIFAQAVAGLSALSGAVRDATGSTVAGAQVVIANPTRGIRRSLESNESGVFSAPALTPSAGYTITVTKPGFMDYERREIELLVGQNLNLDVILTVAGAVTTIQVEASAPLVESTKTGISQVVESRQIQELPINGRRVDSFVLLTPAVVSDGSFGLLSFRGIAGGNSFLTDGNDTTNQFYNENAGRTRITTQISQDAVQEFQVLSNNYSSEFGRASGGVVNTVTRSGSNDVHGTGYWFFRNRSLNARDPYSTFNAPEVRHQAGGSVGGPVVADKLFYFFNGEVVRRRFPLIASLTAPPLFNANGQFVGTCDPPATPAQCQTAQGIFTRQFQVLARRSDSELGFGKLDYRPSERHSVSVSLNLLRWISPNGIQTQAVLNNGNGVGNNGNSTVRTANGRASWTSLPSSSMVNELRFGWFKDRLFDDLNPDLIPASTGIVQITVQGQTNLGVSPILPRLNPSENRYQLADNYSWTLGRHSLKFGGDFMNTRDAHSQLINGNGTYVYPTFTAFALDFSGNQAGTKRWTSYSQRFGNPLIETTIKDYSLYIQDQFRWNASLTLNYGVRYEYTDIPQPTLVNPDYPTQTGRIPETKKNFAPRFGLAYALPNAKTVIRAGYGVFYARYPTGLINNTFFGENGIYKKEISLNGAVPADQTVGPIFPNRLVGIDRNPPAGTVDISFAAPDFRNAYTQQADIGVEHELANNLSVTVSYIWSRGLHLLSGRDLNVGPEGAPVTYRINDAAGNQTGTYTTPTYRLANRVDTRWRRIFQVESSANSWYNAGVVQLRKRLSRGFEGSLAYTFSHAIDTGQGGGDQNYRFAEHGLGTVFNGDVAGEKGSSQLDQRHRLVVTSIWSPNIGGRSGFVWKYLINNWQISQISTFASAQAATPQMFVSGVPFAGAAFNTTLNGFGGSARVPFLPLSSLDIDQIYRTDARLTKLLPISERVQVQLNFEAFNVFNHVSDTAVNTRQYQAVGQVLTPVARLGEGVASQGFPDGTNARRAQVSARLVF